MYDRFVYRDKNTYRFSTDNFDITGKKIVFTQEGKLFF